MMHRSTAVQGSRNFIRSHERTLVAISVIGMVLLMGLAGIGAVVDSIREPMLDRVERIVDYWDDRWTRRVEYGEGLVNAGKYAQAVEYLARLDREFPARYVKHKRDTERERLLRALGLSYSKMSKKRLTLDTYRRLVEFDSRNYESHFLAAMAHLAFRETIIAENYFGRVLAIHPTHMPSVKSVLTIQFEKANFAGVIAAYETYLNAFLMQEVTLAIGQSSAKVNVPVDGRFHDLEFRISRLPESLEALVFQVGEFAIEIKRVTLDVPIVVGKPGVSTTQLWPGKNRWRVQDMKPIGIGSYIPLGPGAALRLDIDQQPQGVAVVRLSLRLFKLIEPELWRMVKKSYENLLRYDDLKTTQARSFPAGSGGAES